MYREIVDWSTSKISAQISSVILLRATIRKLVITGGLYNAS